MRSPQRCTRWICRVQPGWRDYVIVMLCMSCAVLLGYILWGSHQVGGGESKLSLDMKARMPPEKTQVASVDTCFAHASSGRWAGLAHVCSTRARNAPCNWTICKPNQEGCCDWDQCCLVGRMIANPRARHCPRSPPASHPVAQGVAAYIAWCQHCVVTQPGELAGIQAASIFLSLRTAVMNFLASRVDFSGSCVEGPASRLPMTHEKHG